MKAREILGIPIAKIELVSASRVAWGSAARPRSEEASWGRREVVADNSKRFSRNLNVRAAKEACVVHAVRRNGREIFVVIEVCVEHRAVVLAAADEGQRAPVKQEIMRILRVQLNR